MDILSIQTRLNRFIVEQNVHCSFTVCFYGSTRVQKFSLMMSCLLAVHVAVKIWGLNTVKDFGDNNNYDYNMLRWWCILLTAGRLKISVTAICSVGGVSH